MLALIRRYRMTFVDEVLGEDADEWIAELARQEALQQLELQAATVRQQMADLLGGRP